MPPNTRSTGREPLRVSLLVLPDAALGTLSGMFDVLSTFALLGSFDDAVPSASPFEVELVPASRDPQPTASGITLPVHRSIADPGRTDIAPSSSPTGPGCAAATRIWSPGSCACTQKARFCAPPARVCS